MAFPGQETEKYINELLADLHLENLDAQKRGEVENMLAERFEQVVFNTTVRLLDEQSKIEYLKAAMDPDKNEQKIMEITSQAPGLGEAIETALLLEYQSLKHEMLK